MSTPTSATLERKAITPEKLAELTAAFDNGTLADTLPSEAPAQENDDSISIKELAKGIGLTGKSAPWSRNGNIVTQGSKTTMDALVPSFIYNVQLSMSGPFLVEEPGFVMPGKLYGVENGFIERVSRTWALTPDVHMGILLNGTQGTGKTVTAKLLCIQAHLPIIKIDFAWDGLGAFLAGIKQDLIVFIDEFEKVYSGQRDSSMAALLTLLDGNNNGYRRMFVFTSNQNNVNSYLEQRPGRLRYVKNYANLATAVVEELVADRLVNKAHLEETLQVISKFEILTIDTVTKFVDEVNIHGEFMSPTDCIKEFNVQEKISYYTVYRSKVVPTEPGKPDALDIPHFVGRYLYHRVSHTEFDEHSLNDNFHLERTTHGRIYNVFDNNRALVVATEKKPTGELDEEGKPIVLDVETQYIYEIKPESFEWSKAKNGLPYQQVGAYSKDLND